MSFQSKNKLSISQHKGIFNARRATFIYVSFHLMLGLFFFIYSQEPSFLALLNISSFPIGLLLLGFWSINKPYPAFVCISILLGVIGIIQLLSFNLVGLIVLLIVFYYVNAGRKISYGIQWNLTELEGILDAELED